MSDQGQPGSARQGPLVDEVLRKVGRNLVIYQQVERMLKSLALFGRYSGTACGIAKAFEDRAVRLANQTLGAVATAALESLIIDSDELPAPHPEPLIEPWFTFSFGIEDGSGFVQSLQAQIEHLRQQRNRLVHHLLDQWTMLSDDSCIAVSAQLDLERASAVEVHSQLKQLLDNRLEMVKAHAAAMAPDGPLGQQMELHWLQQSSVVRRLEELPGTLARADGWTDLANAGRLLWQQLPDDMRSLQERYGFKTLRALLEAAELFDVLTERHAGGVRCLYRLAPAEATGAACADGQSADDAALHP